MWRKGIGAGTGADIGRLVEASRAEPSLLERLYRQEIEHTLAELDALTREFQGQIDSRMASHVRDSLKLLSACYQTGALSTQALDVLAQHLHTLVQALKQDYANTFS